MNDDAMEVHVEAHAHEIMLGQVDAWEKVSKMAYNLGWQNDWMEGDVSWIEHILQKMAYNQLMAALYAYPQVKTPSETIHGQPFNSKF